MKRILKILGPALALTAILAVLIGGTALAKTPQQLQIKDCTCIDCPCNPDCEQNANAYGVPGPNGPQNGLPE